MTDRDSTTPDLPLSPDLRRVLVVLHKYREQDDKRHEDLDEERGKLMRAVADIRCRLDRLDDRLDRYADAMATRATGRGTLAAVIVTAVSSIVTAWLQWGPW